MTDTTPIDLAHAAMENAPEDATLRLQFYEKLAASELFLLITEEMTGDSVSPEVFDLSDSRFVLVFDREERLAQFTGRVAPYASLSGRIIASMLEGQGIGIGWPARCKLPLSNLKHGYRNSPRRAVCQKVC